MKKSRILLSTFLASAVVFAGCSSKTENSSSSNKTEQKKRKETTRRGFKTRKEAVLCEAKIKTEIANNNLLNTDVTTFKEIYELWYEGYQHIIKESTLLVNQHIFNLLLAKLKNMQLKNILYLTVKKLLIITVKNFHLLY